MTKAKADGTPWPAPEKSILPVGERIRTRRKELKLTLQELATESGLSAPFISQAERNLTIPSLVSLLALAEALSVDLNYFMTIPSSETIVNRADAPRRIEADSPVEYFDLSSQFEGRRMDVMLIHIPPGYTFVTEQRNGEHFRFVVEGEIHATAGDVDTILRAGDSMHFDSRLPHTVGNRSKEKAILLYAGSPSLFKKE
jgi:transcriptional regulator with XRE-family HTH domain